MKEKRKIKRKPESEHRALLGMTAKGSLSSLALPKGSAHRNRTDHSKGKDVFLSFLSGHHSNKIPSMFQCYQ